jgi:hypothetical protein
MRCRSAHSETVSCGGGRSITPTRRRTCSRLRRPIPSEACWIEAIGGLRQHVVDVALQDRLQQMRVDADLGGDQARDAGRPVQQRVAHGAADLVERGTGLGDVDQAALGLVQREALRLHLQRELGDLQPGEGRALGAGAAGQGRAGGVGGLGQAAAGLVDVPLAVRLAGNPARPLGLVDGGVADAEAPRGLARGGGQLGHGGDLTPHEDGLRVRLPHQGAQLGADLLELRG